jgi:type I restriction enzyme, S subunit
MLTHRTTTILGDIPEDWGRAILAELLEEPKGGDWGDEAGDVAFRVLRSTNFTNYGTLKFDDVATRYFAANKAGKMGLKANDLLLERSGGSPTQPVGRIGFITDNLPDHWFSNFVQLLRPDKEKVDPEFLGWVLLELNQGGIVERLQHQTTQMRNLDFRDYVRVYVPTPPREEQETIARVLQMANESLATAEAKLTAARRLKTALMQQLFTRGIPGRHSRFQQTKIGEIPASWEVVPLSSVVDGTVRNGFSASESQNNTQWRVLSLDALGFDEFKPTGHKPIFWDDEVEAELAQFILKPNDLLVSRSNTPDRVGLAGLYEGLPENCIYPDLIMRFRVFEHDNSSDRI